MKLRALTCKLGTRLPVNARTIASRENHILYPGDLDTRKSTGTSCQIEIHFMIKTTEYLL